METHSVFFLENFKDREEPGGLHSPWDHQESDTNEYMPASKMHKYAHTNSNKTIEKNTDFSQVEVRLWIYCTYS